MKRPVSLARVLGNLTEDEAHAVWLALSQWVDNEGELEDEEGAVLPAEYPLAKAVSARLDAEHARLADLRVAS